MSEERREAAKRFVEEVFASNVAAQINQPRETSPFAAEMVDLAMDNVFAGLWLRPGLDRRSRSLLTLGILIALRASEEIRVHAIAALRNGLSVKELEEVIYHATAYAGFPAANTASHQIVDVLRAEKLID